MIAGSIAAIFLTTLANASHAETIAVTDDTAKQLQLKAPATRIVTLAPSLTELAFAAGAGDKVIAVSAYSDYPEAAKSRKIIADYAGVNLEALLALKPDLVIAWKSGNKPADVDRIRGFNIPVYVAEVAVMKDVPRTLRNIGKLTGSPATAETAANTFETGINALRNTHEKNKKVRVFFEISRQPLMTINAAHAIDEVITLCGGENIFKAAPTLVFQPSMEKLFAGELDAILYAAEKNSANAEPSPRYRSLRAAKQGHVYRLSPDPILRPGTRMLEGAAEVCAALERARVNAKP